MKKFAITAVLALVAIGAVAAFLLYNKPHKNIAAAKSDYVIAAPELLQEFQQDETAANQKYLDKVLKVKGQVKTVSADEAGNVQLTLDASDELAGVICEIPAAAVPANAQLLPGKTVTLKGVCTGMLTDVVLVRCVPEE